MSLVLGRLALCLRGGSCSAFLRVESESAEEQIFLSNSMCRQVYSGLRLMGAHIVYPFLFFLVEVIKREKKILHW